MKIQEIYPKYFHKSFSFLYPLLGLRKNGAFKPEKTYLQLGTVILPKDRRLVCVYPNPPGDREWERYQANTLLPHRMFDSCTESADGAKMIYIFDLNAMAADYDHFLAGKAYMESFLYPDKYFRNYAQLLAEPEDEDAQEKLLRQVGELCDRYDATKESCLEELPAEFVEQVNIL
jgi:hypothetical protein